VNPKITKYSKSKDLFEEGCLSFPQIYADIEVSRPALIANTSLVGSPALLATRWRRRRPIRRRPFLFHFFGVCWMGIWRVGGKSR
jgi:hypothetical protein